MKVYLVHGWDGSPHEPMLQWLKSSLEARDYDVSTPNMPDPEHPKIEPWVEKLKQAVVLHEDTILVGHSIGCQAILRYLETVPDEIKIKGVVFIAPWMSLNETTMKKEGKQSIKIAQPWIETPIDFTKIRGHIEKAVAIFSDNDQFVPLEQRQIFADELGASIIVEKGKGHFAPSDNITMLPSALNAVLSL